ncbi:MAG: hypothetical protein LAT64_12115 [Phycisphaerales bacterium]|nr:hypothetical protein [Planctomycetota bacterium]MCH8509498.1 hypothetical protein [Phycisphaerales bacterium]
MTDKLIPSEGDHLARGFGETDDPTGIPSLSVNPAATPSAKPESKVSGQVVLAGVVLVVAAGAIYGMRTVGLNVGFGDSEVKIDYTSQTGTPEMTRRFGRVMTELDASMSAVQLADARALPAAPFTRQKADSGEAPIIEQPNTMDELERLARMAEERRRQLMEERAASLKNELARLHVQSIIGGRVPAARINGMPVTVGRVLGSFEVIEIGGQSVFVAADEMVWELRIGQPARRVDE